MLGDENQTFWKDVFMKVECVPQDEMVVLLVI